MRKLGLAMGVVFGLLAACAPGSPDLDFGTDDVPEGGETTDDNDGGIRILSDVSPPPEVDGAKGRGGAAGAGAADGAPGDKIDDGAVADNGRATSDAPAASDARATNDATNDPPQSTDAKSADGPVVTADAAIDAKGDRNDGASWDARDARDAAEVRDGDATETSDGDAAGSRDDGDAAGDADIVLGTCVAVRACVRSVGQTEEGCLHLASDAARVSAEPVLACETEACATPCRSAYGLSDCNACLLRACAASFVACAQQSGCGDGVVASESEECDDGNSEAGDGCTAACTTARCGDGVIHDGEEACDDGNDDRFDGCGDCALAATHLLITEVVTRPGGAEMIEITNPTAVTVALSDYLLSDSHLYYEVVSGAFTTASGSDFAARFPDGAILEPGHYAVVALGNASGGSQSFVATYGIAPDFELRPTANQATDDPSVPNMVAATGTSIGASASLTDGGEPIVLFSYGGGDLVSDVDYVFFGTPSTSNPMVDKTGIVSGASAYLADTAPGAQHAVAAPGETGSLHRCVYAESHETAALGNGIVGHDETSEDVTTAFRVSTLVSERTPGGPPPAALCAK